MTLELADSDMRILICKNINANEEALNYGVSSLQNWMKHQPHLPQELGEPVKYFFYKLVCNNNPKSTTFYTESCA